MMIIDRVSNNEDTIFNSGKHKHKEVWLIMYDMSNNMVQYGTVEEAIVSTVSIDDMSNITDTVFISGGHEYIRL